MKQKLSRLLSPFRGFHTSRKIVVIESDDWGAVRTSSKKAFDDLVTKGYPLEKSPFSKYDALETNQDIEFLIEALNSIKNAKGQCPKMTLNYIVANPDFSEIKKNGYNKYFYETSAQTASRYSNSDNLEELYKQGLQSKVFQVQLHGREHVNYNRWLRGLREGLPYLHDAFEHEMFSLRWEEPPLYANEYMDAFNVDNQSELEERKKAVNEAARMFESRFSFRSKSFIACCYIWHREMHQELFKNGVEYIQGLPIQHEPKLANGNDYTHLPRYMGEKNRIGQVFLTRNAFFEPSVKESGVVSSALRRVDLAFRLRKPAIISSHRLNFIGRIFPENRDRNIELLRELLIGIVKRWPNVEFLSSDELGDLITKKHK